MPYAADVSHDVSEAASDQPAVRRLAPLDPPTVPFAIGGTALWGIIGLVLLPFRHTLAAHGHGDWLWICLAGFALGFVGIATMVRHDRRRRISTPTASSGDID